MLLLKQRGEQKQLKNNFLNISIFEYLLESIHKENYAQIHLTIWFYVNMLK